MNAVGARDASDRSTLKIIQPHTERDGNQERGWCCNDLPQGGEHGEGRQTTGVEDDNAEPGVPTALARRPVQDLFPDARAGTEPAPGAAIGAGRAVFRREHTQRHGRRRLPRSVGCPPVHLNRHCRYPPAQSTRRRRRWPARRPRRTWGQCQPRPGSVSSRSPMSS